MFTALTLLLAAAGCGSGGPARERVSGTVTLDGKPLESGTISFLPADPASTATAVDADLRAGAFDLSGATGLAAGSYRVAISSPQPGAATAKKAAGKGADTVSGTGAVEAVEEPPLRETIPARYNAETTLKADVKPGVPNTLSFELTSK